MAVEGKKGHGLGESLTLRLSPAEEQSATLRGLLILPGYTKNPGMWRRNGRPARVRLDVGDQTLTLAFDDARRPQIFLLPQPAEKQGPAPRMMLTLTSGF